MKLILTHDVNGLGAPGDVVDVKDGYGRNYLLPNNLATAWTKGGEKQVASIKRARQVREVRDVESAQQIKSSLEGLTVKIPARAGETGRLFGAVTVTDVVEAISAAGGPSVDKRKVTIVNAIKTLGSHEVEVRVHPEALANLTVSVVKA
ncbi:MAG: 50S ribosomal protein L9 [Actinomycetes bacterium]|jgi:large subunit ribosomal protein L9